MKLENLDFGGKFVLLLLDLKDVLYKIAPARTIEGLAIGLNRVKGILLNQNSCGYITVIIDSPFLAYFFVNWPRRQSKDKFLRYQ